MSYLDSLLATDETVKLVTRPHWITIGRSVVVNGLILVLLAAMASVAGSLGGIEAGPIIGQLVGLVAILFAILPLYNLVHDLLQWAAKQYVVTTRRVIEVEGVFSKAVKDSSLDMVNDVVLRQSALGRTLDFGDIEIITGSDVGVNRLESIAGPLTFKKVMLDNKEDFDTLVRAQLASRVPAAGSEPDEDIPAAIERLADLRDRGALSPEEFEQKKTELLSRL